MDEVVGAIEISKNFLAFEEGGGDWEIVEPTVNDEFPPRIVTQIIARTMYFVVWIWIWNFIAWKGLH